MWGVIQNIGDTSKRSCLLTTSVSFDNIAAMPLPNIPANASTAIVVLEADSTSSTPERAAHLSEKQTPTSVLGLPLADNTPYEIIGADNIAAFKVIGIEAGKTHKLQIEYFA